MKKIFLFVTTLMLMTGISKAAKNEAAASNTSTIDNKAAAPAVSVSVSMTEIVQENQALKLALQKATAENEVLNNKLCFSQDMYFATTALNEMVLAKQAEAAKDQAAYAWMMHNVLTTLTALPKSM